MLVDFLTIYIGPPNCVHYLSVEQSLIFEDVVQSLSNMCIYDVCSFILTKLHLPIKFKGPILKIDHLIKTHLT